MEGAAAGGVVFGHHDGGSRNGLRGGYPEQQGVGFNRAQRLSEVLRSAGYV